MRKAVYDMDHSELLAWVLADIAGRANLTPAQKAAHGTRDLDDLRGSVLYTRAIEGVPSQDRRKVHDRLAAEGQLVLRGKGSRNAQIGRAPCRARVCPYV